MGPDARPGSPSDQPTDGARGRRRGYTGLHSQGAPDFGERTARDDEVGTVDDHVQSDVSPGAAGEPPELRPIRTRATAMAGPGSEVSEDDSELSGFDSELSAVEGLTSLLAAVAAAPSVDLEALEAELAPDQWASELVGRRLGTYRLDRVLGFGGMGVAIEAYDLRLGRPVALKILQPRFAREQWLLDEARAAAAVRHPGVAAVYEVGEAEGLAFVAMELVEGPSLRRLADRGPLAPARAMDICLQIAQALGAAHRIGLVHRDLKPDNVRLTLDGQVKLLDFGLAAKSRDEPGDDPRLGGGTPAYVAPDAERGAAPQPQADVYAFGVLAHELCTGTRPARVGDGPPAVDLRPMSANPIFKVRLRSLLRRCLTPPRFVDAVAIEPIVANLAWRAESLRRRQVQMALASALAVTLVAAFAAGWTLLQGDGGAPDATSARALVLAEQGVHLEDAALSPDAELAAAVGPDGVWLLATDGSWRSFTRHPSGAEPTAAAWTGSDRLRLVLASALGSAGLGVQDLVLTMGPDGPVGQAWEPVAGAGRLDAGAPGRAVLAAWPSPDGASLALHAGAAAHERTAEGAADRLVWSAIPAGEVVADVELAGELVPGGSAWARDGSRFAFVEAGRDGRTRIRVVERGSDTAWTALEDTQLTRDWAGVAFDGPAGLTVALPEARPPGAVSHPGRVGLWRMTLDPNSPSRPTAARVAGVEAASLRGLSAAGTARGRWVALEVATHGAVTLWELDRAAGPSQPEIGEALGEWLAAPGGARPDAWAHDGSVLWATAWRGDGASPWRLSHDGARAVRLAAEGRDVAPVADGLRWRAPGPSVTEETLTVWDPERGGRPGAALGAASPPGSTRLVAPMWGPGDRPTLGDSQPWLATATADGAVVLRRVTDEGLGPSAARVPTGRGGSGAVAVDGARARVLWVSGRAVLAGPVPPSPSAEPAESPELRPTRRVELPVGCVGTHVAADPLADAAFVTGRCDAGDRLVWHVGLATGHVRALRRRRDVAFASPCPSPDGHRLALSEQPLRETLWVVEGP